MLQLIRHIFVFQQAMRTAGALDTPSMFLISDTQIVDEAFLEDIESLLNTGEIPNLFPPDEKHEIVELVREKAQQGNKQVRNSSLMQYVNAFRSTQYWNIL